MKDESFELLTKLYAEFSSFKKNTGDQLTALSEEMSVIRKSQINIETVEVPKVDAALDGYKQVYEKLLDHDQRFDAIEDKIQTQDVRIGTLKKVNA